MSRNKVRKQQAVERHNAQYVMHRQLEELNARSGLLFDPQVGRTPGKSKPVSEMLAAQTAEDPGLGRGQTRHILTAEDMGGIGQDDGGLRRGEFAVVSALTPADKAVPAEVFVATQPE